MFGLYEAFHLLHRSSSAMQSYLANVATEPTEPLILTPGAIGLASSMHTEETLSSPTDASKTALKISCQYLSTQVLIECNGHCSTIHGSCGDAWLRPLEDAVSTISELASSDHTDYTPHGQTTDIRASSPSHIPSYHHSRGCRPYSNSRAPSPSADFSHLDGRGLSFPSSALPCSEFNKSTNPHQLAHTEEGPMVSPHHCPWNHPVHTASINPQKSHAVIPTPITQHGTDTQIASAMPHPKLQPPRTASTQNMPTLRTPSLQTKNAQQGNIIPPDLSMIGHNNGTEQPSRSVFYAGIIAAHITQSSGSSRLVIGRSISDPIKGDMFAILRQDQSTVMIISIRVVGLNRKDKWVIVCDSGILKHLADGGQPSSLLKHIRSISRSTMFRECPVCGAPAEPNCCFCSLWTSCTEPVLRSREFKRMVFEMTFGGSYVGVMRQASVCNNGLIRKEPGMVRSHGFTCWSEDQGSSVHLIVSLLLQNALAMFIPPAPVSLSNDFRQWHGEQLPFVNAVTCSAASDRRRRRKELSSRSRQNATVSLSSAPTVSVAESSPQRLYQLAEAEKERKAYDRKLRNRASALRSNLKRSQRYKKLIEDVEARRSLIENLSRRMTILQLENQALRHEVEMLPND